MICVCQSLTLETAEPIEIVDITDQVRQIFAANPIRDGLVTIYSAHTTAYVCINEKEPMLKRDMLDYLCGLVPRSGDYRHNVNPVDGRYNAHSHLIGLFMNASESIPVADGELLLGGWQSVFFIELDGPRPERTLRVQVLGERP